MLYQHSSCVLSYLLLDQLSPSAENMTGLMNLREKYADTKPFSDKKIGVNLHVTKETAVLIKTLLSGGAKIALTGCNAFSTQDAVAAALQAGSRASWLGSCIGHIVAG